jgi:L-histidine N-alpha-methyltransferase
MTFTPDELDHLVAHLAATGEIDTRYSYLGGGAATWDRFVSWQQGGAEANVLHSTLDLLRDAHDGLVAPLPGPVRVVDLGPGNGVPVRGLLERLRAGGRLERYVGVDTSAEMLAVAEANLRAWLGPAASLAFHRRDFTADPLGDLRGPATLVLLAGGTLLNFADPVAVLRHVREVADVIVWTARADTGANRAFFRFGETNTGQDIPERYRAMLDRLGVRRDRYEPEVGFDDTNRERYLRIRLTGPVTIGGRLALPAGRRLSLWRYLHRSADELAAMRETAGYSPLIDRRSRDGEFVLLAGRRGPSISP